MRIIFALLISVITLSVLTVPTFLFAQNYADSLKFSFENITGKEQFEKLEQQIREFKEEENENAIAYANDGLELARKEKDTKWEAIFLVILADLYSDNGSIELSNQHLHKATPLFQELKDPVGVAKVWAKLGRNDHLVKDFDRGLENLHKAKTIFESVQEYNELYSVFNYIGNIHRVKAEYTEALKYYEEAISISETNNLSHNAFFARGNKAFVYHKMGNPVEAMQIYFDILNLLREKERIHQQGLAYHHIANLLQETLLLEEAIQYYHKALNAYSKSQNSVFLSTANLGLGELLLKQGKFETARHYFEKGLEIKQNSEIKTLGEPYYHLGDLYLKQKKYKEALFFFNKSLSSFREFKDQKGIDMVDTKLGIVYLKTNELEKAEKYLLKVCKVLEQTDRIRDSEIVYENLYELYQLKGNYFKALTYEKKLQVVKDSLYGIEKIQKLNKQLLKEALHEKELVLDSLRRSSIEIQDQNSYLENLFTKSKKQQNVIILFCFFILTSLILWLFKIRKEKKAALIKLSQNENVQHKLNELINTKNKDINNLSIKLIGKNQTLNKLKDLLEKHKGSSLTKSDLNNLLHSMQADEILHQDWDYFHDMFNELFPEFFTRLKNTYTSLSKKDLRLCGLIRSNLSPLEVSEILGISLESVHSARYRLRKKLNLKRKDDLDQILQDF